jgi:hypothetical protein
MACSTCGQIRSGIVKIVRIVTMTKPSKPVSDIRVTKS